MIELRFAKTGISYMFSRVPTKVNPSFSGTLETLEIDVLENPNEEHMMPKS